MTFYLLGYLTLDRTGGHRPFERSAVFRREPSPGTGTTRTDGPLLTVNRHAGTIDAPLASEEGFESWRSPLMRCPRMSELAVLLFLCSAAAHGEGNVTLPRYPAISPNGASITFSWRGDVFSVPTTGGDATRLTSHAGRDHRTAWLPDGSGIVFESDRDGARNLYSMNADGSNLRQLTDTDAAIFLNGIGANEAGDPLVSMSGYIEGDVYRDARSYEVPLEGGQPQRMHDAFGRSGVRSADGTRVAFVRGASNWFRRHYRGPDARDVWIYDDPTDTFTQMTSWEGNDGRPRWARNSVLFLSDRINDTVNLFLQPGGDPAEETIVLTNFSDRDVTAFDVTPDGKTAVVLRWDTLYVLDLTRAEPNLRELSINAPEDSGDGTKLQSIGREVTDATRNPDGMSMAMIAYGDVYVRGTAKNSPTRRVTETPGRETGIAWSPDGTALYFASDADGSESIMIATVALTRNELKTSFDDATAEPEPEPEPNALGTWTLEMDIPDVGLTEVVFVLEAGEDGNVIGTITAPDFTGAFTGSFDPSTGALDGTSTVEGHGESRVKASIEGDVMKGTIVRAEGAGVFEFESTAVERPATENEEEEEEDDPSLDPARWADAIQFDVSPFLATEFNDHRPAPSPDGKSLAFIRERGDLMILDLASMEMRLLRKSWDFWSDFAWSPDSHWLAYDVADRNFNSDIFIVPADGSAEPVNITRHPDNDGSPMWSADGKILVFGSERKNDEWDVWMVELDAELAKMSDPERKVYFKDAAAHAKKRKPLNAKGDDEDEDEDAEDAEEEEDEAYEAPFTPEDLQTAYLRLARVTSLPGNESNITILPSGETILFTSSGGSPGTSGLYSVSSSGSDRKKLGDTVSIQEVSLDGAKITAVGGSQAQLLDANSGKAETIAISDRISIDLSAQSRAKFREAARTMGTLFYHPSMKGLDWEKLSARYEDLAAKAHTADEFNEVAGRFLGELNASHLGLRASAVSMPLNQSRGRLGTLHDPVEGGFRVSEIIPDSAAEQSEMPIEVGDLITAIDFEPFAVGETIQGRLKGRVGDEVVVSVTRQTADGDLDLDLLITPQTWSSVRALLYKVMQQRNARLVEEWSDGRLGYAHIRGMSQGSLDEFERDLFAATEHRDGLIVDVRNNGGGWTADRLLASLMVQPHAYTVPRGADPTLTDGYPQDRLFIQRYALPVNMLCNEKSFSNAEIVSHAFKTLGRGTLVGQQTYGGVISTGGTSLIDGTTLRLPFRGWYLLDGTDMENNGAMPDIVVEQTPEDEAAAYDAQLKAAVDDLLDRLETE